MKKHIHLYIVIVIFSCQKPVANSKYAYSHLKTIENIDVPIDDLNCNCHTQGIAWEETTNSIVVTCEGEKESFINLFKLEKEGNVKHIQTIRNDAEGRGFSHPSAIQIHKGIFPVAIAAGRKDSSFIYFYRIINDKLEKENIPALTYHKHIGALGISEWNGSLYLIGLGWDSKYYALWKSNSTDEMNFELISDGEFSSIAKDDFGAYNSVYFNSFENNQLQLFASYGSFYDKSKNYIDVYSVDIVNDSISLRNKNRTQVKGITKGTTKSLFFEGFTIKEISNDTMTILSAPQDFKKRGNSLKLKSIYEGLLIEK